MIEGKEKRIKGPTIRTQILALLAAKGPMEFKNLTKTIPFPRRSVHTKALELRRAGLVETDENGLWSLAPGAAAAPHKTGEVGSYRVGEGEKPSAPTPDMQAETSEEDLGLQARFALTLIRTGAQKGLAEMIASLFFAGDVSDLHWLHRVLCYEAKGFLTVKQANLVMAWWAMTYGLRYNHFEFFED